MSYTEFFDWIRYRNEVGPLNQAMRTDQIISQVAATICNILARKKSFEPHDFTPWIKKPEQTPVSAEDAFVFLSAIATKEDKT